MPTFQVYGGKQPPRKFERVKTVDEADAWASSHSHIWFEALDGSARLAKVNGRVRRWKTDPGRIEIPLKYGLYEYATFTARDIHRILKPVDEEEARSNPRYLK